MHPKIKELLINFNNSNFEMYHFKLFFMYKTSKKYG